MFLMTSSKAELRKNTIKDFLNGKCGTKVLLSVRKMANITDIFETPSIELVSYTVGLCQTH